MSYSSPLTLAVVKNELGITDGTYDSEITERLPYAEAKFKLVANNQFRTNLCLIYDNASDVIKVYQGPNSQIDYIKFGDIIQSEDFPDGTYVIENFRVPNVVPEYDEAGIVYELKVSQNSTAESSGYGSDAILGYNISHYAVMSQIVWFMISEQSTGKVGEKGVNSKRVGPLSVSYSQGDINQRYGLPNKIVQQVPKYSGFY